MRTSLFLLFVTLCSLLTTGHAFAYPGEVENPEVKIPEVEKWKVSTETPPKNNYSNLRLSVRGTALKPDDPCEPVLESVFYEDPAHPGEFGAIFRAKNEKDEWVIFAKCWDIKKIDGQWAQDIDSDKNGRPDDNGGVTWAIVHHDGNWRVGVKGEANFSWEPVWHNWDNKDYPLGFRYVIAGKDSRDPSGLFLYSGRVMKVAPEPEDSSDDENGGGAEKPPTHNQDLDEVAYVYYSHRVGMTLFKIGDKSIAVAKSGATIAISKEKTKSLFVKLGKKKATDGSTYESVTIFVRSKLEADALLESMKVNQPITLEKEED